MQGAGKWTFTAGREGHTTIALNHPARTIFHWPTDTEMVRDGSDEVKQENERTKANNRKVKRRITEN